MVNHRPLQTEQDWWRVRGLLIEAFPLCGPGFNWEIRRWDGGRFHRAEAGWEAGAYGGIELWETDAGRLVGAALTEGDEIQLQIHPDFRSALEAEMLAFGEEHFASTNAGGQRQVHVLAYEYDTPRQRLLAGRGYGKMTYGWVTRWLRLNQQALDGAALIGTAPRAAAGYRLRTTHPADSPEHWADCQRMVDLLNAAFNRPGFHQPGEYHNFMVRAPIFLNELNLVMEAPDGSLAAHAALNYDSANRYAIFEPVCTHPRHRRRGLAQALMLEGIRRARALGARIVEVSTGDADAANALYDSICFGETYKAYAWKKVW